MLRRYHASRGRFRPTPRGQILTGTLEAGAFALDTLSGNRIRILGWIPRDYATWEPVTRQMHTKRIAGGHIARVQVIGSSSSYQLSESWIEGETA